MGRVGREGRGGEGGELDTEGVGGVGRAKRTGEERARRLIHIHNCLIEAFDLKQHLKHFYLEGFRVINYLTLLYVYFSFYLML